MATKRLPRPRDPLQLGKLIVDIATGQVEDAVEDKKDAAAADLGSRGGKARAHSPTAYLLTATTSDSELEAKSMYETPAVRRIPEEELAELWFSFRQDTLSQLQVAFRDCGMQEKLVAERLGKDPATISRCLRGKENMTLRTMHNLARGMGYRLRVGYVVTGDSL